MRLRHATEIVIFYAVLAVLNYFIFPNFPGFVGIDPHPYWIGVLLFGFRYGIWAGFLAGLLSAALYLGMAWFGIERYVFEDLSFYILPSLFVIVGTLVGVGVYQYRSRIDELDQSVVDQGATISRAEEDNRTLKDINAGLEKRIVTRMQTIVTLYEGARSLSSTNMEVLYPAILRFIMKTLDAEEAAIYVMADGEWRLHVNAGWKAYENHPTRLKAGEGLTGIAARGNKVVTIRDFIGATPRADFLTDCMMAGPIRRGERGEVVAVLSIQNMPFLSFNSASVNLFSFLLDWASRSVGQALEMNDSREREIWDPTYNVFSYRYFLLRAEQEWLRSRTYYLPLSVGFVRIDGLTLLSQTAEDQLFQITAQVLRDSCRDVDVVARNNDPDAPFAFLLITASPAQAVEIRQKIMDAFARLRLQENNPAYSDIRFHVGMGNFSPKVASLDALINSAHETTA
jgi:GGDEF domain-containing protein